jgi:hypothetical protein
VLVQFHGVVQEAGDLGDILVTQAGEEERARRLAAAADVKRTGIAVEFRPARRRRPVGLGGDVANA